MDSSNNYPSQGIKYLTAVIVSRNEGHLLKRCIQSLSFCNEVILIDLSSEDNSVEIAKGLGAKVFNHKPITHVEIIHSKIGQFTSNNWIVIIDPDEELSETLANDINFFLANNNIANIGAIRVPWKYYFNNKPLRGTRWGGDNNSRILIVNRKGFIFNHLVHEGRLIKPGYQEIMIPLNSAKDNVLHHFWMHSFRQLIEKHLRYISVEGEAMHEMGLEYNVLRHIKRTADAFKDSYFTNYGYKDGFTGLFLSIFWCWYTFMKWSSLKSYNALVQSNFYD